MKTVLLFLLLVIVSSAGALARPVVSQPPEILAQQAPVVCNGLVVSVTDPGEKIDSVYDNVSPPVSHEKWMCARIKVLHVFKGSPPQEFDLRYRVESDPVPDGPEHVFLKEGSRYRFFLKPGAKTGDYLDVLDSEIDDTFAVESIGPAEADDSSWLTRDDVIQIARKYVAKEYPSEVGSLGRGTAYNDTPQDNRGAGWTVVFWPSGKRQALQVSVVGGKATEINTN